MRFGGSSVQLLVASGNPFGALARFELFEQLQFALGFEHFDALVGDLLCQLRAALLERCGAALNVRLEMR